MRTAGRALAALATGFVLALAAAPAASATPGGPPPLQIVHSETVPLGDSTLTVSFTDWPVRAGRSLDFTFVPEGGIAGRTGVLRAVAPSGQPVKLGIPGLLAGEEEMELTRHPRERTAWGLDVVALPEEGTWRLDFTVRGREGTSTATLPVVVSARPGPPPALSWTIGMLPWVTAVAFLAYRWIRTGPTRRRAAADWNGSVTA